MSKKNKVFQSLVYDENHHQLPLSLFKRVMTYVALAWFIFHIFYIVYRPNEYQWDFKIYYGAAYVHFAQDLNPYIYENIINYSDSPNHVWGYPPITLNFFQLFQYFSESNAYIIWLGFKLCLLFLLFWIWHRYLYRFRGTPWEFIFFIFAFNSAFIIDLRSGNVTIIEQFLIWSAIVFLLRRQLALFCILIGLTFQLGTTQFILLGLPLFLYRIEEIPWFKYVCYGSFSFALFLLNPLIYPDYFEIYVNNIVRFMGAGAFYEGGLINPCLNTFITDIIMNASKFGKFGIANPSFVSKVIFYGIAIVVVAVSMFYVYRYNNQPAGKRDKLLLAYFYLILFSLILPRFKDYDYILLLLPAFHILMETWHYPKYRGIRIGLILCLLYPNRLSHPVLPDVIHFLLDYLPLFGAVMLWFITLQLLADNFHFKSVSGYRNKVVKLM